MRKILLLAMLFIPGILKAQTFFVSGRDDRSREHVIEKIKYEGYKVTADSITADYLVEMLIDGAYKVISFKMPYSGYIKIVNIKSGEEIGRTKVVKGNPGAINGYNAAWMIFTKISKKYLPDELKKCKK